MERAIWGAALCAILALPAAADERIDRSIDEAAARIVAERMGSLRGGFSHDEGPLVTRRIERKAAVAAARRQFEWEDGLARAVEIRVTPEAGSL